MRWVFVSAICLALSGCGKQSAEKYFAAAEEAQRSAEASLGVPERIQDSLFTVAIGHYEDLVDEHPGHPLAQIALFRVAEMHNNGTRNFQKAIWAYEQYLAAYPATPQAAVSLFMIAFLYHNELHNLDSASSVYQRFLSVYPTHELASSARSELDNLGKAPEQIIEKHLALSNDENSDDKMQESSRGR